MEQYTQEIAKLYNLEKELKSKIFGQNHVIDEIVNTLKMNYAGLGEENKPLGSFLFLGSTGVGKTELAIELSKALDMNFERFDMSEYHSKSSKSNLIGGASGLVGYEDGGILTNAILENPQSVVLFDEIEKADQSIIHIFLQILDYGILSSTKGDRISFDETIIIFTSNLGANNVSDKEKEINEFLTPEFRARLNAMLEFNSLSLEMVSNIVDKLFEKLSFKLNKKNILLDISQNTLEYLTHIGFEQKQGARGISKVINTNIIQRLSHEILFGTLKSSGNVFIDVSDEKFIFKFNSTNGFIDEMDSDICRFDEYNKALQYAKENPGFTLTNDPYGNGFIVKS